MFYQSHTVRKRSRSCVPYSKLLASRFSKARHPSPASYRRRHGAPLAPMQNLSSISPSRTDARDLSKIDNRAASTRSIHRQLSARSGGFSVFQVMPQMSLSGSPGFIRLTWDTRPSTTFWNRDRAWSLQTAASSIAVSNSLRLIISRWNTPKDFELTSKDRIQASPGAERNGASGPSQCGYEGRHVRKIGRSAQAPDLYGPRERCLCGLLSRSTAIFLPVVLAH